MVGQPFSYTDTLPTHTPFTGYMENFVGFRISAVPEPSTAVIVVLGAVTVLFFKPRR
jgi:hypothetical protein